MGFRKSAFPFLGAESRENKKAVAYRPHQRGKRQTLPSGSVHPLCHAILCSAPQVTELSGCGHALRYPSFMPFRTAALFAALSLSLPLVAQTTPPAGKSVSRPVPAALKPYTSCRLPGGPDLIQTTPLPQAPLTRPAQTLTGVKQVKIMDGLFAAFAYPNSAPFANIKIEQLPASTYAPEKAILISEFDGINAKGEDTQRNYALKPTLNGFEIYGFDRTALDGNVLGIYLFFDNSHHIATTAYFLNAPAGQRRFNNIQDYSNLREGFLNAYTQCVRKGFGGAPAAPKPAAAGRPGQKASAKR